MLDDGHGEVDAGEDPVAHELQCLGSGGFTAKKNQRAARRGKDSPSDIELYGVGLEARQNQDNGGQSGGEHFIFALLLGMAVGKV